MAEIRFDRERIERYFSGEYSEEDKSYIKEIFSDKKYEDETDKILRRLFNEMKSDDGEKRKNLDHILYKIHYDINTRSLDKRSELSARIIKWGLRIAGVILLPLLVFLGIKSYTNKVQLSDSWVEIKAPAWTRADFSLPDGTTGCLNSNSSIKYSTNFKAIRQITLKGEAYFDVFRDPKRPFIVLTKDIRVRVLGTRFSIASYDNENNVEVILEQGKLEFSDKEFTKTYIMKPNDLLVYDKKKLDFSTEEVQPQKYLSWKEGKLVFRNDPLDVIARRLERWYNIDVEINGNITSDLRLRGTFLDEDLEEVLDLLKRSLPIDYRIENRALKADETYSKRKVILTLHNN
jgi:ferric-dicitrate binding protein FerR (iron transport regulator)